MRSMLRSVVLPLAFAAVAAPVAAQQPPAAPTTGQAARPQAATSPDIDEVQALIERMQKKIERMDETAEERERALQFLEKQVEEATALIGQSSETAQSMKERAAALQVEIQDISRDRDVLSSEVGEREQLLMALEQRVAALTDMLGLDKPDRHALGDSLELLRARLKDTLAERDALQLRLQEAEQQRAQLEARLAELGQAIENERKEKAETIAALEADVESREKRIGTLQQTIDVERSRVRALDSEIARLNLQLARLKDLLGSLDLRLQQADEREQEHVTRIADLQGQLAMALARRVEELEQYRSEFFGRLKKALADRPDVKIVGDRFVLPAELLFPSGSAQLEPGGRAELEKLAATLVEVAQTIPSDIDWVLRVDGHTDKRPLRSDSRYRSNWELSTARALTVVQFLIDHGIPPDRLMAAGFGEFQPVDPGDSEEALRRNRRIEFKLTQR